MKYVLRIISLSVVLLLSMVLAASAADQTTIEIEVDGTSTDVYKVSDGFYQDEATYAASTNFYITNKAGLEYFQKLVSASDGGNVVLEYYKNFAGGANATTGLSWYTGNVFTNKTVHLLTNIDLNNDNWTPIGYVNTAYNSGSSKTYFYGSFNGHNHKILNLKVVGSPANYHKGYGSYGLFGSIGSKEGQTFSNLTIENVEAVNGTTTYDYVGALIGNAGSNLITIENCHVTGNINLSASYEVGAFFGIGVANITNCSVNGESGSTISSPNYYAGGLAGCQRSPGGTTITNCTVKGVTISADNAGGMVGLANVAMTISGGSVSNTEITGTSGAGSLIGSGATSSKTLSNVSTSANVKITENNKTVVKLSGSSVAKIGDTEYNTLTDAISTATEGQIVKIIKAGTYTLPAIPKNITIEGDTDGVVINGVGAYDSSIASTSNGVTFRNLSFNMGNTDYRGFQHPGPISFDKCVINGRLTSYGDTHFTNCTFNAPGTENSGVSGSDYSMWVYGPGTVKYTSCDFYSAGKVLNVYNEGNGDHSLYVEGCKFHSTSSNKAALNVKATCGTTSLNYKVYIDKNSTTDGNFPAAAFPTSTLYVIDPVVQVDDINSNVENGIFIYMENENGKITHEGKNYKQVYPYSLSASIEVSGLDDGESEILSLNAGETKILSAELSPDNAVGGVSWSTEGMDTSILTAKSNDDGTITLTAGTTGGTTTIRVASQYYTDVSKDITVKVSIPTPAPSPTPTPTPEPEPESDSGSTGGGGGSDTGSESEPTPTTEPEPTTGGNTIVISSGNSDSTSGSGASDLTGYIASMSSSDKAAVTELIVTDNKNLTSLEGVEQLENLESINLNNCTNLESVNLSANTSLTNIAADNCASLQVIEVKNNENLETLSLKNAVSLQELDVSGCSSLSSLDCSGGNIENLNLNGCASLTDLNCQNNNLNSLDVSGCSELTTLECSANNLGELNVEGCENLSSLSCSANSLSTLDLISCRMLERLYCYSNNLTEIKLSTTRLSILVCDDNNLGELKVEDNKQLKRLDCQNNSMPALDVTSSIFSSLERLKCYGQKLSGLNITSSGGAYQFDLNSYITASTASVASVKAAESTASDLNNISNIKAYDASGNEIEITSNASGVLTFASKPAKIVYDYDVGYNGTKMDVTISDNTNKSGSSSDSDSGSSSGSKKSGGGGGGGCNSGFNFSLGLLFILALAGVKSCAKYF